jgi:hypothetical protein
MLEPQKKIEMLKNKMQESRKTLDDDKTSSNPVATAFAALILYVLRIILFYYAINVVLDKFKFESFSFLECFLIFSAIVGIIKETAVKQ